MKTVFFALALLVSIAVSGPPPAQYHAVFEAAYEVSLVSSDSLKTWEFQTEKPTKKGFTIGETRLKINDPEKGQQSSYPAFDFGKKGNTAYWCVKNNGRLQFWTHQPSQGIVSVIFVIQRSPLRMGQVVYLDRPPPYPNSPRN